VTRLLAAELLKLRTVRATWGFVLVAALLAALATAGNIGGASASSRLDPEFQFRIVLDASFAAVVLALLLGVILVTSEFRHGTIARTLLVTPRRGRLLGVKLVAGALTGLGLMLLTFTVITAISVVWLGLLDVPLQLGDVGDAASRTFAAAVLAGVLGAAVGGTVHSQVGALVGTLVWIFVAEPLCWVLLGLLDLDRVAEYLPASSVGGMVDSSGGGLSFAGSVAVSLAWVTLVAALAFLRLRRRDIT
jgi:ABC-type transport system involved in multi-copper enzyme maturation permease subunit